MTTAHRPTFYPAQGGTGKNEGDLSKLSKQYSARDMPAHKKMKYRQEPQIHGDEVRNKDLRRSLEERENRSREGNKSSLASLLPPKRPGHEDEEREAPNVDVDDPLQDDENIDSNSDDDSEDEAALMAELAAIKKERAAERAENEARQKAEQERIRREDLLQANPLLQAQGPSNFTVKRRWDDDVVFKNCAKGTDERKKQPNFINDSIRSDFHRKFMEKIRMRWHVFILTFVSYAFYHASRKNLSGVKGSIITEWMSNSTHDPLFYKTSDASSFLGALDALFMMFYAGALVFWGYVGDRWNPLHVVFIGMLGSGFSLVMFGALPFYTHFYSITYYVIFYAIFGIFQAAGWPNEVTIMANWFTKNNRGFIMGLWAACQPVGNIIGAIVVSLIQPYGYELTFIVNSVLIVVVGFIMWRSILPEPLRTNNSSLDRLETSEPIVEEEDGETLHQPISMVNALILPNVLPYCLCNACLKFVNYAFFFWLPYYLHNNFKWEESVANQLSAWYDFGGIIGSVVGGLVSDRLGHRSPVITTMLVASLGLLIAYSDAGDNKFLNVVLMSLLGFTISGPYNLIVGTISVDLGSQPALAGNSKAMSTVTGLIDASGSAGSAIGQLFVPLVQNNLGWVFVFYLFIVMNFLSVLCLMRRFIHDMKDLLTRRRPRTSSSSLFGAEETSPLLHQD